MSSLESRRKNDSLMRRLRDWFSSHKRPSVDGILAPHEFNHAVLKEQMRCARRPKNCQFCLAKVKFDARSSIPAQLRLAWQLRESLRMVDEIAWANGEIALLLPETGLEGAAIVVARIPAMAALEGLQAQTEIFSYPEDDAVAGHSADLFVDSEGKPLIGSEVMRIDEGHSSGRKASEALSDFEENSLYLNDDSRPGSATAVLARPSKRSRVSARVAVPMPAEPAAERSPSALKRTALLSYPTPWWKHAMDVSLAAGGLLLLTPLFAAVAIAIKLNSRGPVFYLQEREGKDGRVFGMLKFRTMRNGAEALRESLLSANLQDGPAFKVKDDPRVTAVGRYLRKSCIDELPQLLNVLKRDMSLVGPRPLPVDESRRSGMWQRQRLTVLPGLTCLWQVAGDRDMKFERWMRLDLEYIRRRSLWLDIRLIFRTVMIAILHRGNA